MDAPVRCLECGALLGPLNEDVVMHEYFHDGIDRRLSQLERAVKRSAPGAGPGAPRSMS
jgi:hypothetical protein